nr:DUF167 domain-containing protein [Candidatus Njordarchaeum guaymaensis]
MRFEVEVQFRKDFLVVDGNRIVVGLVSRPERGKANLELVKKLAKHFDVSSSQVRIISGLKSRKKIVEIEILR